MTYWRLHCHLIWSTVDRNPTLTGECEKVFYGVLYRRSNELGVKVHAAGNKDHHKQSNLMAIYEKEDEDQ